MSSRSRQTGPDPGPIDVLADTHRRSDKQDSLGTGEIFDILSNNRRRLVLYHLRNNGNASDLRTLSKRVAAWENDVEPENVTSDQRMRAYTALRQSHLPKMDRQGVIEFDKDRGTVTLQDRVTEIEDYLEAVFDQEEQSWAVFLGVGAFGLALSAALLWEIGVFARVPDVFAGLVVSLAVILAAIAQIGVERLGQGRLGSHRSDGDRNR